MIAFIPYRQMEVVNHSEQSFQKQNLAGSHTEMCLANLLQDHLELHDHLSKEEVVDQLIWAGVTWWLRD